MTSSQLIVPMTYMLNIRDNHHQEWYGSDAFFDLGFDDDEAWGRFKPKGVCCVINYIHDGKEITDPEKLIEFALWIHDFTEIRKRKGGSNDGFFAFCGRHLTSYQLTRSDAHHDAATKDLFNSVGDFKQFKIRS